ncbi:S9 family peptidase [Actinospica durhamensis]|uniref:S9 family peptidase n=1 Tax=Actinospica durhamensis TaxID=1508375 RepID=A0A941ETN0_9ACTN|nr:S9 family peptidase [Actinospica durhamensis]MBR7833659.1 S9 family peptidase [Actinospica durhamensis]
MSVALTPEAMVDCAAPWRPTVAPDGRRVAYLVARTDEDGRRLMSLWVGARRLLADQARISALRWNAGSDALYYVAEGQVHRIAVVDGAGAGAEAEPEALTDWPGRIVDQVPLADGRTVAVVAPDERDEDAQDEPTVWGEQTPPDQLRLLDLERRELNLVDELCDRHVIAVAARPDGDALAVISWAEPMDDPGAFTARLHVVDPHTGKVQDLGALGIDARSPAWWRDRDDAWHVAYIAVPPGEAAGMAVFDATESGHRNLTADLEACPVELVQIAEGAPLALFAQGLDTAVYRLDPVALRFDLVLLESGLLDTLSACDRGEQIAARKSTSYEPKDVFAGPVQGPLARLSDVEPELRQVDWGRSERLVFRGADGLELDGLLILPPGRTREDGPFPLITSVHGGPYFRHCDDLALYEQPAPQWLAAAGYAVFLPNPRGSQGRGGAFARLVLGAVGRQEYTDILAGIDLLVAEGVADPDRLGISGWSHGGFMAAWAIGQTDRFKAALMGAGISDWGMQVGLGELGAQDGALAGGFGWEGPGPHPHDVLSPISYASRVRTPVLILHGDQDQNVPLGQAVYFHRALRHHGVEHEFVVYPGEGHGIVVRSHRLDLVRRSLAWFDRWLRPAA